MLAFGTISGVAMVAAGMSSWQALAMSVLVYAGNSQLAALQIYTSGSPMLIAILAGIVINLRFCIYSLAMAQNLGAEGGRWRPLLAYILSDNGYAMALGGIERARSPMDKMWFCLGSCSAIWVVWQVGTLTGVLVGARIPASWHLEFSIVLTFLGVVAPTIRDRAIAAAACAAAVTAVLAWSLPLRLGLLLAVTAGISAGLLVEHATTEARPRAHSGS